MTLKERAETDPALQRALEFHRVLAQSLARDYWKTFQETHATSDLQSALRWAIKMHEAIEHKAAEYEAEAGIPGLGEQYLAYFREERERLSEEFPFDWGATVSTSFDAPPPAQKPASAEPDRRRMSMSEVDDALTLEKRAETDPVLQRVLSTYRTVGQSIARDYMKLSLEALDTGGIAAVDVCRTQFLEGVASKAKEYEAEANIPGLGDQYIAYIDEELKRLNQEIDRDPAALRRNLGVPPPPPKPVPSRQGNQRMSMGEMAVRTAVRATVWTLVRDAIRAIFR
ncbi:hypothetical protein [Caballeronia concitans]|uniref:hypothetical protein n=1 Tax=Caballeronia concitans TaxID=1777133 RepID=UPI00117C4461|nr:hypothetical protein [Caballeronia concitans]